MIKPIPSYLKLLTVATDTPPRVSADLTALLACCRAFESSTGWPLEFVPGKPKNQESNLVWSAPVDPGVGASPGHIRIISGSAGPGAAPRVALPEAQEMAAALAGIWDELLQTRRALWQREAELAAGVPVAARPDEAKHLAARLETVLAAGAEAVACQVAALYLLDAGTSELKLRASWGLPRGRFVAPARPLRGAAADLEALLGHAVVLSDSQMFDYWRVPEPCAAAVCVPVSSPTTPLGTLWLFANESRDFTAAQTNLLEIIAGRLAADLEREMLLREVDSLHRTRLQLTAVERCWQTNVPPSPCLDGWDIAGWIAPGRVGGGWCDWFSVASDQLAISLGICSPEVGGAIAGRAVRAAVRTAAGVDLAPAQLLERLNAALWTGDDAEAATGLGYAMVDTHHGVLRASHCGSIGLVATIGGTARVVAGLSQSLGAEPQLPAKDRQFKLADKDIAVFWSGTGTPNAEACVARVLEQQPELPVAELAIRLGDALCEQAAGEIPPAALVLRRQKKAKR